MILRLLDQASMQSVVNKLQKKELQEQLNKDIIVREFPAQVHSLPINVAACNRSLVGH